MKPPNHLDPILGSCFRTTRFHDDCLGNSYDHSLIEVDTAASMACDESFTEFGTFYLRARTLEPRSWAPPVTYYSAFVAAKILSSKQLMKWLDGLEHITGLGTQQACRS